MALLVPAMMLQQPVGVHRCTTYIYTAQPVHAVLRTVL